MTAFTEAAIIHGDWIFDLAPGRLYMRHAPCMNVVETAARFDENGLLSEATVDCINVAVSGHLCAERVAASRSVIAPKGSSPLQTPEISTGTSDASRTRLSVVPITLWWLGLWFSVVASGWLAAAWFVSGFLMVVNCVLTDREARHG